MLSVEGNGRMNVALHSARLNNVDTEGFDSPPSRRTNLKTIWQRLFTSSL